MVLNNRGGQARPLNGNRRHMNSFFRPWHPNAIVPILIGLDRVIVGGDFTAIERESAKSDEHID
jgi:hypothetical protein